MQTWTISHWAAICLLAATTGCSTTGLLKWDNPDEPKASLHNPVVKILALWQPADGIGIDNKASRGFAAQIYFLTQQSSVPSLVDGAVRVYLFDDQGVAEEQVKPIHQFDFPKLAWDAHKQKGKLGPTYTVFVPYTRKGRHEANCSLRIRYTPRTGGPTMYSEMANVQLPGASQKKNGQKNSGSASSESGKQDASGVDGNAGTETAPNTEDNGTPITSRKPRRSDGSRRHNANLMEGESDDVDALNLSRKPNRKQPAAVQLTAAERERIIRETKAKLESEQKQPIRLTGFEQPEADKEKEDVDRQVRRKRHVLADAEDDVDDAPAAKKSRPHPLDRIEPQDAAANDRNKLKTYTISLSEQQSPS